MVSVANLLNIIEPVIVTGHCVGHSVEVTECTRLRTLTIVAAVRVATPSKVTTPRERHVPRQKCHSFLKCCFRYGNCGCRFGISACGLNSFESFFNLPFFTEFGYFMVLQCYRVNVRLGIMTGNKCDNLKRQSFWGGGLYFLLGGVGLIQ